MAEPQPPTVREGDTSTSNPAGGSADSRAAAAALSSLDAADPSASNTGSKTQNLDVAALGDAVARLEVAAGGGGASKQSGAAGTSKGKDGEAQPTAAAVKKPPVKVEAADVAIVVDACDLSKVKATELLKQHEGNLGVALRAWVGIAASG